MLLRALKSILALRISSDRADGLFVQLACYIGAVGVLACMDRLVHRFATTPFEILAVLFMDLLLALALVILGVVISRHGPTAHKARK